MLSLIRKTSPRLRRTRARLSVLVAGLCLLCLLSANAFAQSHSTDLEHRVQTLEKEVESLKVKVLQLSKLQESPDKAGVSRSKLLDNRDWKELKVGMTEESVRSLLGQPSRSQTLSSLTYWYYEGGTSYIKPHVVFENDNHLVYGWQSP